MPKCQLQTSSVDVSSLLPKESVHEHDKHGHDKHEAHDKHGHDKHEAHDKHDHSEVQHSEIHSLYRFECAEKGKIDTITFNVFEYFPKLSNLNVMWITETKQSSIKLSPESNSVSLR